MKLGIGDSAFPADWPIEKVFRLAKEIGFDGIELWMRKDGYVNVHSTKEDMLKIRECADRCGIQLYSLASGIYWSVPLSSDDPEVRATAKSYVSKQLELAQYLGCDTILVVPGAVGVDFMPHYDVVDYDVVYERAVEWVDELKAEAEERKVYIGIENVWNKFLLSPFEMREFVDRAKSEYVGAYFDVGNVLLTGYPEQWVKLLGSRIKQIHLKDYSRADGFVDLLKGDVNYPVVMKALRQVPYDGWLTAEYGFPREECETRVRQTFEAMQKIVAM